jgi:hypothetical protein
MCLRKRDSVAAEEPALLLVGDYPIKQLVLYANDFGWMAFWTQSSPELKFKTLVSLLDLTRRSLLLPTAAIMFDVFRCVYKSESTDHFLMCLWICRRAS